MRPYIKLLRPSHWVKNLLVFAPFIFAMHYDISDIGRVIIAWLAFSLVASSVYVMNDIYDRKADAEHPTKKERPIASGLIKVPAAIGLATVVALLGLYFAWSVDTLLLVLIYGLMNVAYSSKLKHMLIMDVMVIAFGFVLRILVGGHVIGVPVSHWILVCTFFGALFVGFGKRQHEVYLMTDKSRSHRAVLEFYTPDFLSQLLGISAALSVLSYSLYTIDPETTSRFGTDTIIYTIPFVVYGIFRYFHLLYNHAQGGDPTKIFIHDKPLRYTMLAWLITFYVLTHFA